uniref:Ig-like domain-containing protein n=1 Tax=Strigops habroptila TaxID=2489341 RepID=A0A672UFR8_STRHB
RLGTFCGKKLSLERSPAVTWLKDGEPLAWHSTQEPGSPRLSLAAVGPADAGVYSCLAANEVGEASKAFHLLIQPGPEEVRALLNGSAVLPAYQVEHPGDDALLHCDARGHPLPLIRWSKDGVPVVAGGRLRLLHNGSLAIRANTDAGHYRCVAENDAGTAAKVVTLALQSECCPLCTPFLRDCKSHHSSWCELGSGCCCTVPCRGSPPHLWSGGVMGSHCLRVPAPASCPMPRCSCPPLPAVMLADTPASLATPWGLLSPMPPWLCKVGVLSCSFIESWNGLGWKEP